MNNLQVELSATHEERNALQVELATFWEEREQLLDKVNALEKKQDDLKKDYDALFDVFQHSLVDNVHVSVNQFIRDFEDVFIRKFVPTVEYKSE